MFRRLVATSRAPQIMVLSMLRSFGKIGPRIDQIWAWLSRGHRWSPGVRNPLKSSVTGPSLLVNCYLEIKFHKIIRVNPPLNNNSKIVKLLTPNNDDFGRYEIVTKNKVRCQKKMLFNEAMANRICKGI